MLNNNDGNELYFIYKNIILKIVKINLNINSFLFEIFNNKLVGFS